MSEGRSADFEAILDEVAQEYAEAEIINRWMPPDGQYPVVATAYNEREDTRGTNRILRARLTVQIMAPHDPDGLDSKEFDIQYSTQANFTLKGDVAVLAGKKVDNIRDSLGVLKATVGQFLNVNVETTVDKKTGRSYRNARILNVIENKATPPTDS